MSSSGDEHAQWKSHLETLPPIRRDGKFWAMTSTQFLGAFNDNLFKQLVLLLCTDVALRSAAGADSFQPIAFAFFSLPFVMFSGYAGYLSDLWPKRRVVILCKVAEIAIMALGALAFYMSDLRALFVVLFLMGTQSAFFGPSKYGALPEMFRERDLPYVNGVFIMTTFLSIILGTALAGVLKDWLGNPLLWLTSTACIFTAVLGTLTAYFVRSTPVANPGLKFRWSTLAIDRHTWRLIRRDRPIRNVLYITSVFWMIGGVIQMGVNAFGKYQLAISDRRTSLMLVCVAAGIAVGCVIAGRASKGRVRFGIYRVGNFILVITLSAAGLASLYGPNHESKVREAEQAVEAAQQESLQQDGSQESAEKVLAAKARVEAITTRDMSGFEWTCRGLFFVLGVSAGLFTVPLQTLLQVRPPDQEKGRVIAAMNFLNWIGIFLAAAVYFVFSKLIYVLQMPQGVQFLACAVVMALMYLYRLDDQGESPHANALA